MGVTKATAKPKFKAYISDFTLEFAPLSLRGKMVGIRKSAASTKPKFSLISPDGNPVEQFYYDAKKNKYYKSDECNRSFTSGEEVTTIDKETLEALKKSELPKNTINLTVHDSQVINDSLFPDDKNAYIFVPDEKDPKNVTRTASLVAAIKDSPDMAFLGTCNFHGSEGLYKVTIWRGHLVLQRHLYPNEVNDHEVVEPVLDNEAKMLKAFFEKRVTPFNPETYRNTTVDKQMQVLSDPSSLENILSQPAVPTDDDLASLLAAFESFTED
jgi:hypothetical protein